MSITCPCCGEPHADEYTSDGRCWECGAVLRQVVNFVPRDTRSEEEKIDAARAAAHKKAEEIFPVLVSKLATCDKFQLHGLVSATCKKHGRVFAAKFMELIAADERFAPMLSICSPAQRDGRW